MRCADSAGQPVLGGVPALVLGVLVALPMTVEGRTVSVTDYGAKGDAQTDDAAAVRKAIAEAAKAGGGTVRFPGGRYLLRSALPTGELLRLASNVRLVSAEAAELVDPGHDAKPGAEWKRGPIVAINKASGCEIRGLHLRGPGQGVYMTDAGGCVIRDCVFAEHSPMAVYGERSSGVDVRDCVFDQCVYGLYLRGPVRWRIQDNRFRRFGRAIEAQGAVSCQITGNFVNGEGKAIVGILLFPNSDPRYGGASTVGNLIAHNEVRGIREEGISLDCRGNAPKWYYGLPGMAAEADATSLTDAFANEPDLALAPSCYVVLLKGRGAGQHRRVESVTGRELAVSPPWRIVPDKTTHYCLIRAAVGNQIIGNRVSEVQLAGIMLWGACLDTLVSDNVITRSHLHGIAVCSLRPNICKVGGRTFHRALPAWRNQITNNILAGRVPGKRPTIAIHLAHYYGEPAAVPNYGKPGTRGT